MPRRRDDPYLNFNFLLEIDGVESAGFRDVELPEGRIDAVEYREGADRTSVARKLPGRVEYGQLVLRRGFAGNDDLYQWWEGMVQGNIVRRTVAVVLLDEERQEVARWLLRRAWPSKLQAGDLHALGNEVVIETLELTHEGFELA
jgi:phage tail-like protein